MFTSGRRGEQRCVPVCGEVGCGCSSIGAKSQRCGGGVGSSVKATNGSDAADCAAQGVHVGGVADAATVAAVLVGEEGHRLQ